ncbi:MAG: FN3 associated domain-containing protein [Clostridia bacterium]
MLKNKTDGATIHYTVNTDGSVPADPTVSSSVFDEAQPIVINGKTVIKAFAVKNGVKSAVVTLTYTTKDQLASPTASIESGAMVSRGTRLKLKAASGATIY